MGKKYKLYLLYFILYVLVMLIFTWPVITNLKSIIYAQSGDAFATLYDFWKLPFSDFSYYFPNQPIFLALAKMLRIFFAESVVYNIFVFASFILTAIAGFLLFSKITKNNFIAFWGGLVLMIAPFRIAQTVQHLNFSDLSMLLLFIYFLLEIREKARWLNIVGVFFFLVVITLINYQYGFFAIVIYLIYLISNFIFREKQYKFNFLYSLGSVIGASLVIILVNNNIISDLLALSQGAQTQFIAVRSFKELGVYSAQWIYFFTPSPDNPFFGQFASGIYSHFIDILKTNRTEQIIYLGIINLILGVIAIFNYKKINKFIFWFAILLVIFGIYFSFAPNISFDAFSLATPSELIFKYLPFFRVYSRLGLIAYFGVIILSGFGLLFLVEKIKNNFASIIFKTIIILIIVLDLAIIPSNKVTVVSYSAMPGVYKTLMTLPRGTLAEYPLLPPAEPQSYEYLLWQRIHQVPILYSFNDSKEENDFRKSILNPVKKNTIEQLKSHGVTYIIVHKDKYWQEKPQKYPEEYNFGVTPVPNPSALGLDLIGEFDSDLLYKIK